MRKFMLAVVMAAALPAAAHAAVDVKFWAFTNPSGAFTPAGPGVLVDFETYDSSTGALNGGFSISGVNGWTVQSGANGNGAMPMTANGADQTRYLTVYGPDPDGSLTPSDGGTPAAYARIINATGYRRASFYWGSVDTYNSFYLLGANGGRITGPLDYQSVQSGQWNGDQAAPGSNGRVTIVSDNAFYGIEFRNTGSPAFEVDNVTFAAAVPEPATWAMMLVGFGGIGTAMRRRRSLVKPRAPARASAPSAVRA